MSCTLCMNLHNFCRRRRLQLGEIQPKMMLRYLALILASTHESTQSRDYRHIVYKRYSFIVLSSCPPITREELAHNQDDVKKCYYESDRVRLCRRRHMRDIINLPLSSSDSRECQIPQTCIDAQLLFVHIAQEQAWCEVTIFCVSLTQTLTQANIVLSPAQLSEYRSLYSADKNHTND